MQPCEELRTRLEAARRVGGAFDLAWEQAVAAALATVEDEREAALWDLALRATRDEWEAAYDRAPSPRARLARAVASLAA